MLTAPSPLAFVGIAFSFWTSAYLASRTSYSSATRVVRWALIVMGVRFMHDVLYSNAKSLDEALLWQRLFFWTFVLAPTLWYCWSLTFSPLGHRTRWLCSLVAIGLGFGFVAARITPNLLFLDDQFVLSRQAPFGFLSNSIKPGPLYPFFCLYYVGMLAGALLCFVLAYRRATLRAERHALAVLVTAALILMLGEVYVTITIAMHLPTPIAPEQALLCAGILLVGYGVLAYAQRDDGRMIWRDFSITAIGGLGPVALYGCILLFALHQIRVSYGIAIEPWIHYPLVALTPFVILTHSGFDQLRALIDLIRANSASRPTRKLLRTLARQIGTEQPSKKVLDGCLADLATLMGIKNLALFWMDGPTPELLSQFGMPPSEHLSSEDLCVQRPRRISRSDRFPNYDYLFPLRMQNIQRGALLIGGWRRAGVQAIGIETAVFALTVLIADARQPRETLSQAIAMDSRITTDLRKFHRQVHARKQPQVYIKTLGTFEVFIDDKLEEKWRGGSAGANQLRNMLAYLIARTGSPIQRDVLIEVAGGRGKRPPEHVIPGLKNMLKHWGMGDALQQRGSTFILKPTDSWRTDTDELVELFEDAKAEEAEGHHESAIALLKQAQERDLCTPDADYLPTFDAVPDYSMIIQQKREEWANYQANVLRRLAELGLKMTDRASWDLAASTARLVVRFDPENPESFLLVAKAEEHRGNLTSAREYRNKAAELTRIAIEDLD